MTSTSFVKNSTSIPTDCIVLQYDEYIPWNNPDNIVSYQTEDLVFTLNVLFFLPVLFLIACPANIINMIVFYKHGLKERINVCLFALSFADEVYMWTNFLCFSDQLYLRFTTKEKMGPVTVFLANHYLLGFHGFIWISQILSAIIASERCFCVLYPLRSQSVLRTSTIVVIIIAVHVVILGLVFFEMLRYTAVCVFDPLTDSAAMAPFPTKLYYRHQKIFDYLDIFVLGITLPMMVLFVVVISTVVTAVKLKQAAQWRATTSSNSGVSVRDIALTRTLVVNSIFFIICLVPFTAFRFVFLIMPEVNVGRRHHNMYVMSQAILLIISYFNATFNIVIYYTMGSRYRQTFWQLFSRNPNNHQTTKPEQIKSSRN